MLPELILVSVACILFLVGVSPKAGARQAAAVIALLTLVGVFGWLITRAPMSGTLMDQWRTFRVFEFARFIKILTAGMGVLLLLLAWPSNRDATGNASLEYGKDASEFFALMLLSLAGVFIVAGANDIILLFLGIELASIPTYIMVSTSRPIAAAQEAGVKYFFLGAMAAAVLLFGLSYLYGTTGLINIDAIGTKLAAQPLESVQLSPWQTLAAMMIIAGIAFKIAAVPLHFYAPDVYQGAATPVTAFLSFVPKISGFVALIKILFMLGGNSWDSTPALVQKMLWVIAALTMSVGNVLGLLQFNVKRTLAYSSIAHSGYMLVGLAALCGAANHLDALQAVLFYLASYGIMNVAAFGVLIMLPSRRIFSTQSGTVPATTAETFEDLAGQGRAHPVLGLAMAISCFSLIGIPLTVGFFGKLFLVRPALDRGFYGLVIVTMINAAVSAAYYLKIVAAMFLRAEPAPISATRAPRGVAIMPWSVKFAVIVSVGATILFGAVLPATQMLSNAAQNASNVESGATVRTDVTVDAIR